VNELNYLGVCAVENGTKINPGKCKEIIFTSARVRKPMAYFLGDKIIPESSSCKYLGTIL